MQMVMVLVGGYVVASAPIMRRAIIRVALLPRSPRAAIAMVALVALLLSLISWGMSLIFSALLVRELARRVEGMDYRAAGLPRISASASRGRWTFLLRRNADGDEGFDAARAVRDQRNYSAHANAVPVAELATAAILIAVSVTVCFFAAPLRKTRARRRISASRCRTLRASWRFARGPANGWNTARY